jgi:predicted RNA-binding Zn ribbon-like protein
VVTKPAIELELVGGDPALDFANTVEGPRNRVNTDSIRDGAELMAWAAYAGVLDPRTAERLTARADDVLPKARELRAAIYDVFRAIADGDEPSAAALARLAAFDAEAVAHARLTPADGRFDRSWSGDDPERVLWPLAHAAVDLLRHGPLDRLKLCHDCRWLFIDSSRNRSRRWCSMNECGGRSKMRRYRERMSRAAG